MKLSKERIEQMRSGLLIRSAECDRTPNEYDEMFEALRELLALRQQEGGETDGTREYSVVSKEGHKVEVWPDLGYVWFSFGEHCYGTGAQSAFERWHKFFSEEDAPPIPLEAQKESGE